MNEPLSPVIKGGRRPEILIPSFSPSASLPARSVSPVVLLGVSISKGGQQACEVIRLWLHKLLHLIIEDPEVLDVYSFIKLQEGEFLADHVRPPCQFELIELLHFSAFC